MPKSKKHPNLYIIAGPNGAGKTTFATEFLPQFVSCPNFVNADLIAKGFAPFSPESVAIKAGRLFLKEIRELSEKKIDFSFETTLSGKTYISLLKELKKKGYIIHLFFLWVPDVELSLGRIRDRVLHGGHNIPPKDVKRRFKRSVSNFFKTYKPLSDHWMLFDNATNTPRLIASESDGKLIVEDKKIFEVLTKLK